MRGGRPVAAAFPPRLHLGARFGARAAARRWWLGGVGGRALLPHRG